MSSKLRASPSSLKILQPKRLNALAGESTGSGIGSSSGLIGGSTVGNENVYGHQSLSPFQVKQEPGLPPAKALHEALQACNDPGPFGSMAGNGRIGGLKSLFGTPGSGKKGVVTMAKRNARERNRVKQAPVYSGGNRITVWIVQRGQLRPEKFLASVPWHEHKAQCWSERLKESTGFRYCTPKVEGENSVRVNQGFQTLRQHIPETYRLKKMSKVDTLRCALDYIRSLEDVLGEFSGDYGEVSSSEPFMSSGLSQHLDRICGQSEDDSHNLDQSRSFSYSEPEEDGSNGFLQLERQDEPELKLVETSDQYIAVMVPMALGQPLTVQPDPEMDLKLF